MLLFRVPLFVVCFFLFLFFIIFFKGCLFYSPSLISCLQAHNFRPFPFLLHPLVCQWNHLLVQPLVAIPFATTIPPPHLPDIIVVWNECTSTNTRQYTLQSVRSFLWPGNRTTPVHQYESRQLALLPNHHLGTCKLYSPCHPPSILTRVLFSAFSTSNTMLAAMFRSVSLSNSISYIFVGSRSLATHPPSSTDEVGKCDVFHFTELFLLSPSSCCSHIVFARSNSYPLPVFCTAFVQINQQLIGVRVKFTHDAHGCQSIS